jgi:hypothetical protein
MQVPSIEQLGFFSLAVVSQITNVPVNQPVNFSILSCPTTETEQLIIGSAPHTVQHYNLLLSYFAIGLKVF